MARRSATTTCRRRSTGTLVFPVRTTWATCSSSSGTSRTSTEPAATSSSPGLSTRTCTRSRPSVSTLYAIVSQLGISFDELFARHGGHSATRTLHHPRAQPGEEQIVQRAVGRPVIELESGVRWERLNPTGERDVDFLEVEYSVGGASSRGRTLVHH